MKYNELNQAEREVWRAAYGACFVTQYASTLEELEVKAVKCADVAVHCFAEYVASLPEEPCQEEDLMEYDHDPDFGPYDDDEEDDG